MDNMKRIKYTAIFVLIISMLLVYFIVAVDKWNQDAIENNKRVKEYCPCGEWKYITKGHSECECPHK